MKAIPLDVDMGSVWILIFLWGRLKPGKYKLIQSQLQLMSASLLSDFAWVESFVLLIVNLSYCLQSQNNNPCNCEIIKFPLRLQIRIIFVIINYSVCF